jgi:hypothetical protein
MAKASKMGWGSKGDNGVKMCLKCSEQIKPIKVITPSIHMEYECKCGRFYRDGSKV